jgi:hypothetical protein
MFHYDTLTEALNDLRKRGYHFDFNIAFDSIVCQQNGICLNPVQFEIDEHYRFEGDSNPDDEEVIYAISSKDQAIRGVLVSAFGIYSDPVSDAMLHKLTIHKN